MEKVQCVYAAIFIAQPSSALSSVAVHHLAAFKRRTDLRRVSYVIIHAVYLRTRTSLVRVVAWTLLLLVIERKLRRATAEICMEDII